MLFRVENQVGVVLRVLISDNDFFDGFKLELEEISIIIKEVSYFSDLFICVVVLGEEKILFVNGLQNFFVLFSVVFGDLYVMKIIGKGGEMFCF